MNGNHSSLCMCLILPLYLQGRGGLGSVRSREQVVAGDRAGNGGVVRDGLVVLGNQEVSSASRDLLGDGSFAVLDLGKGSGAGSDGSEVLALNALARDLDLLSGLEVGRWAQLESGESNDGELGVAVRAALDERCSQGVGLVEVGGHIVSCASGVAEGSRRLDPGCVASLGGEDGASSGEVGRVGDVGRSAEVGRYSNALEELRGSDEALDVCDTKVVLALLDCLVSESLLEELNVALLVSADLDETLADPWAVACLLEVVCAELCQTVTVERTLEVLQSQGIVEDDGVDVSLSWCCSLLCRSCGGHGGSDKGGEGGDLERNHG